MELAMILFWIFFPLLASSAPPSFFASDPPGALRKGSSEEKSFGRPGRKLQEVDPSSSTEEPFYPAQYIDVPIDHFPDSPRYEPHSAETFKLRYYYDAKYYQPGGPVILLEGGELDAEKRLAFLSKGIVDILAKATNGIGVVLEHRYYGESIPTPDFSTENLRFLTTEQAVHDAAFFAQNFVLPNSNVSSGKLNAPWIIYGGSYAGALAAFARIQYPDTFWGAIGSSAVIQAIWDFWQYYEPIRDKAPAPCVHATEEITALVDLVLSANNATLTRLLKQGFGLEDLAYDDDFANAITYGISQWQSINWDPAVSSKDFGLYCSNVTSIDVLNPSLSTTMAPLLSALNLTAVNDADINPTSSFLNYMNFIRLTVPVVASQAGETVSSYYNNHDPTYYAQDSLEGGSWRAWPYQYCTEWGYMQSGSGAPPNIKPLVSRVLTPEYESLKCQSAFNRTTPADVDLVNRYGGYDISYKRLAFVGGTGDPWLYATPGSPLAPPRESTDSEPVITMEGAVHHWDENGVTDEEKAASTNVLLPPLIVQEAQQKLVDTVQLWVKQWASENGNSTVQVVNPSALSG